MDYVNIGIGCLTAVLFVLIIMQIVYIQSKLHSQQSQPTLTTSEARIPFGVFAVYVDDVKTAELNAKQYILPSVSTTYFNTDKDFTSIPNTTSYSPTNYYVLALRETNSADAFKLMIQTNNANYVIVNKALYGAMYYKGNIFLYTPIKTSANDVLNILSFAGASTGTSLSSLKTLSSSIPVHILAYKV
jgi:hypothetical protein